MIKKLLFLTALLMCITSFSQNQSPNSIIQGIYKGKTIALRDMPVINEVNNGKNNLKIIPNNFPLNGSQNPQSLPVGGDPIAQTEINYAGLNRNLEVSFDGPTQAEGGAVPPDPSGAVGPDHYVSAVNVVVEVFDKQGNTLAGPTSLGNFIGDGQNSGDPIIMYDQLADRWFVSQFNIGTNGLAIAISETPDPTGAYFLYEFPLDSFPDYPHYSIWHDAYYMTANKPGDHAYALERDVMLAGDVDPQILGFTLPNIIVNPNTVFSPEPAYLIGETFDPDTPGYFTYLQDDGWGATFDHLKIWEMNIDWNNPGASFVSAPLEVPVTPFDSFFAPFGSGELAQPGTGQRIDMITGVISYATHYRPFDDHNSWLVTFNVDVAGDNEGLSGVRWIELRNSDTEDWTVFQEGTYAPADGNSRFMGSGGIDAFGNIGLAFNIGAPDLPVGIAYTGRFVDDALGTMTFPETTIVDGVGIQSTTNRFGDYSQLSMDPDNFTFWHTAEYFGANNFWTSRIASFRLSGGFANDVGINAILDPVNGVLTDSEIVQVSIRNFGTVTQTEIPIELYVDGALVATETYMGSIDANSTDTYTFTQTIDLSIVDQEYQIEACTLLVGDEFDNNNCEISLVTNLIPDDVGISDIISPVTASGLGLEDIVVRVENFGGNTQSNFDLEYSINGGTPVIETFTGTLLAEDSADYTFTTQADLSALDTYTITVSTNLPSDTVPDNDSFEVMVSNTCTPTAIQGCQFHGIKRFVLNTIDVDNGGNGCNTEPANAQTGYADRTNLITTLSNVAGQNNYILQAQHNFSPSPTASSLSAWIDFDDNGLFEVSEQVIMGVPFQSALSLNDFNLVIPVDAPEGEHILRVRSLDTTAELADLANPCSDLSFGETQDYTVDIEGEALSLTEQQINNGELIVNTLPNNNFDIQLNTDFNDSIFIAVFNMLGQQLSYKPVAKNENGFRINLDLSAMASGVYLIRLGSRDPSTFKTAKIIVN